MKSRKSNELDQGVGYRRVNLFITRRGICWIPSCRRESPCWIKAISNGERCSLLKERPHSIGGSSPTSQGRTAEVRVLKENKSQITSLALFLNSLNTAKVSNRFIWEAPLQDHAASVTQSAPKQTSFVSWSSSPET